jgi:hypothetical protein
MSFSRRLLLLEAKASPVRPLRTIVWAWGSSFDDALSRSGVGSKDADRLLIQLVPAKGGHGKPVEKGWRPEYQAEYDKAHAWAVGG